MDLMTLLMGAMMKGNLMPSGNFNEIVKLHEMLEEEKIPHMFKPWMGGYMIKYFGHNEVPETEMPNILPGVICSIIEHNGSYGHEEDLLEIQGLRKEGDREFSGVSGYLSAEDVFNRIKEHYNNPV